MEVDNGEIQAFCSSATHAPPTKVRTSTSGAQVEVEREGGESRWRWTVER